MRRLCNNNLQQSIKLNRFLYAAAKSAVVKITIQNINNLLIAALINIILSQPFRFYYIFCIRLIHFQYHHIGVGFWHLAHPAFYDHYEQYPECYPRSHINFQHMDMEISCDRHDKLFRECKCKFSGGHSMQALDINHIIKS